MPQPGDRYDRFEVDAVLGQGGMATVYRVRHGTLGSFHALKVLDIASPAIRARLVQEGQVQARLRHPNVVTVTDLVDVGGAPGLVMEYVDGPTLEAWLRDNRPDPATIARIFDGILDAVAYAHEAGLVHRDLKPGNVLIETVSGRLHAKVTDFGLAKVLGPAGPGHTRTGLAMGTPGYMAPEQIRSARDVDLRTDIFALGCILFELWCGEKAFPDEDIYTGLERMERRGWTDPVALRPDLPPAVAAAINGALEPDRERRFASVQALRDTLDGRVAPPPPPPAVRSPTLALAPPPSGATLDFASYEEEETPRRWSILAGLGVGLTVGVVLLALCAGAAWWVRRPVEAPRAEGPAVEVPPPVAAPTPVPAPVEPPRPAVPDATPAHPKRSRPGAPVAVEAPTTEVEPAPAPVPATISAATPAPTPPAPAPTGRFVVEGGADRVWLQAGSRRYGQGEVPAGSYTLHARFGESEIEIAAAVPEDGTLTVACNQALAKCVVR